MPILLSADGPPRPDATRELYKQIIICLQHAGFYTRLPAG
jgi:hypothetical protein